MKYNTAVKAASPTGKPSKESAAIKQFDAGEKVAGKRPAKKKKPKKKMRRVDAFAGLGGAAATVKEHRISMEERTGLRKAMK